MKGAGARKSSKLPIYFEGGQLPLVKRLPMIRGKSRFQSFGKVAEVNLGDLEKLPTTKITLETLKLAKLIDSRATAAKVIATGKLTKALTISGLRLSAGAKKTVEAAGGEVK
jgi:large subunit ribosomal protein L15